MGEKGRYFAEAGLRDVFDLWSSLETLEPGACGADPTPHTPIRLDARRKEKCTRSVFSTFQCPVLQVHAD